MNYAVRKVLGSEIPVPVRWPLTAIATNFAALSVFMTFFGTWLVGPLKATAGQASAAFMLAGAAGMAGGYLGGRLTDRIGPRPVAVTGSTLQVACAAALLLPALQVWSACAVLVIMTFLQPLRNVAQRIALVESVPGEERDGVFAAYRLVVSVGTLAGPLLGSGLVSVGWWALHLEAVVICLISLGCVMRLPTPAKEPKMTRVTKVTKAAIQTTKTKKVETRPHSAVFGDIRLYGLMLATISAWTVVYTYETVLPIVLSQSHGLSPSDWGRVYALGPALVVLFQLRIARWIAGFSPTFRLAAGTVLMGAAFLTLMIQATLGAVLVLTVAFIVGNMIWGPASEQAALRLAPEGHQGTYLGMMSSSIWLGSALAPGLGLPLRENFGDTGLWIAVLSIALLSAASYLLTNRLAHTPGGCRKKLLGGRGVGRG